MQAYGRSRDAKVLDGLDRFRYMTTPQIAELFFGNLKTEQFRIKKTCERMRVMYGRGYVQRFRFPSEPYIYTVHGNKYNRQIQHYLMIVDCWITLQKMCPSGGVLRCEVEHKQENVITDLVVEYKNNFRPETNRLYWIEVENKSNGDIVEKIQAYASLNWLRLSAGLPEGELVIVYSNPSLKRKIEGTVFDIKIKTIPFVEFKEQWVW